MAQTNYIADTNRFQLAGPPKWFLRHLWEFDPSLVIVPSRQGFYYRLAQRRKLRLPEKMVNDVLKEQADTGMLASYGLVPITTILATARWDSPLIWVDLAERAPWRHGGANAYMDKVEALERDREEARLRQVDEHLDYLARDSWNLYRKKQGLRSHLWSPRTSRSSIPPNPRVPHGTVVPGGFVGR